MATTDKKRLAAIIAEIQSRGLAIPEELAQQLVGSDEKVEFTKTPLGYYYRQDGKEYKPNDKIRGFLESRARFSAVIAGRGSGKSAVGSQKALAKIEDGFDGAVMNPDFENFKLSTWPEFREWIPWKYVVPSQQHRQNPEWQPTQPFDLIFDLGTKKVRVICKGLKNPGSARGPNINWLWYDEAGRDDTGESWQTAVASVRIGEEPQAWVTTTPAGRDHWIYEFFEEQNIAEEVFELFAENEDRPLVEIFYSTIFDNKDNLDPGFFASMLATYPTGWLRDQELYGKFVSREGSIGGGAEAALRKNIISVTPDNVHSRLRYWDLAATEKKRIKGKKNDPDETVGTLMSWVKFGHKFYIEHQISGMWEWSDLKRNILQQIQMDGPLIQQVFEQEPASGGKNQVAELIDYVRKELPGWPLPKGWRPQDAGTDRVLSANTWIAEAVNNRVFIVDTGWDYESFLKQLGGFPLGRHDDKVTSVTGARYNLAPIKKWKNVPFLSV